jgi:hypothetical protein
MRKGDMYVNKGGRRRLEWISEPGSWSSVPGLPFYPHHLEKRSCSMQISRLLCPQWVMSTLFFQFDNFVELYNIYVFNPNTQNRENVPCQWRLNKLVSNDIDKNTTEKDICEAFDCPHWRESDWIDQAWIVRSYPETLQFWIPGHTPGRRRCGGAKVHISTHICANWLRHRLLRVQIAKKVIRLHIWVLWLCRRE